MLKHHPVFAAFAYSMCAFSFFFLIFSNLPADFSCASFIFFPISFRCSISGSLFVYRDDRPTGASDQCVCVTHSKRILWRALKPRTTRKFQLRWTIRIDALFLVSSLLSVCISAIVNSRYENEKQKLMHIHSIQPKKKMLSTKEIIKQMNE